MGIADINSASFFLELAVVVIGSLVSIGGNIATVVFLRRRNAAIKQENRARAERRQLEKEYRDRVDQHEKLFNWLAGRGLFDPQRLKKSNGLDDFNPM